MNEKIKELAEQAGMEDYPVYGVNTLYGDAEIEKFAELIVRECVAIVDKYGDSDEGNHIAYQIEKHFRDEE